MSAPREAVDAAGRAAPGAPSFASTIWDQLGAPWAMSLNLWSAWADTWDAVLRRRGAPALDRAVQKLFDPAAWPAGFSEELQDVFALPRFADLPSLDSSTLPSAKPSVELMFVAQQYLQVLVQVWHRACTRFQTEVAERRAAGERFENSGAALDLWNTVLDRTLMEFNRSADFAQVQQNFLRAASQQRLQVRKLAEKAAQAVDMPTRTELDDVYRRLHDLLRETHALKREIRALKAERRSEELAPPRAEATRRRA